MHFQEYAGVKPTVGSDCQSQAGEGLDSVWEPLCFQDVSRRTVLRSGKLVPTTFACPEYQEKACWQLAESKGKILNLIWNHTYCFFKIWQFLLERNRERSFGFTGNSDLSTRIIFHQSSSGELWFAAPVYWTASFPDCCSETQKKSPPPTPSLGSLWENILLLPLIRGGGAGGRRAANWVFLLFDLSGSCSCHLQREGSKLELLWFSYYCLSSEPESVPVHYPPEARGSVKCLEHLVLIVICFLCRTTVTRCSSWIPN